MIEWQKEHAIDVDIAAKKTPNELKDKLIIGQTHHDNREEYSMKYQRIIDNCARGAK